MDPLTVPWTTLVRDVPDGSFLCLPPTRDALALLSLQAPAHIFCASVCVLGRRQELFFSIYK